MDLNKKLIKNYCKISIVTCTVLTFIMVALFNRADHYIFILFLSSSSFFFFLA